MKHKPKTSPKSKKLQKVESFDEVTTDAMIRALESAKKDPSEMNDDELYYSGRISEAEYMKRLGPDDDEDNLE